MTIHFAIVAPGTLAALVTLGRVPESKQMQQ